LWLTTPPARTGGETVDHHAVPLADFIAEVLLILSDPNPSRGEILVERVEALRWAEKKDVYDQMFSALNRQ
jgi:uncharacterized oxidoreductase